MKLTVLHNMLLVACDCTWMIWETLRKTYLRNFGKEREVKRKRKDTYVCSMIYLLDYKLSLLIKPNKNYKYQQRKGSA